MQITIELPDWLGTQLTALSNPQEFILQRLTESYSLEPPVNSDPWPKFLADIDQYAVATGISDLAEHHDHYLYQPPQ
jgi:hypothetical protein